MSLGVCAYKYDICMPPKRHFTPSDTLTFLAFHVSIYLSLLCNGTHSYGLNKNPPLHAPPRTVNPLEQIINKNSMALYRRHLMEAANQNVDIYTVEQVTKTICERGRKKSYTKVDRNDMRLFLLNIWGKKLRKKKQQQQQQTLWWCW